MIKIFLLPALFLTSVSSAFGQKVIQGVVEHAQTGAPLAGANIVIKGTYRGTITNADGHYALSVPDALLPATLKVSFIGFKSTQKTINEGSGETLNFKLSPSANKLKQLVVTGERPTGNRIMERVIRHKQQWRKDLHSYKADAYTRQTLSRDTTLATITETTSESYWDEQKGHREIIKSRKQTANVSAAENVTGTRYVPNFYDDNIQMLGFDMVGVTNPQALKYYNFKLMGQTSRDRQTVYKIKVIPKRQLQPLFKGTVYVLDEAWALLKVQLTPNEVVKFPPPINSITATYEQQYNNFGRDFWLPVDMRLTGSVKIGIIGLRFPKMKLRHISKLNHYKVNIPLPDSLYKKGDNAVVVDTATITRDSLITSTITPVPLSQKEKHAYATVDSSQTLEKAFKPHGFFARFIDFNDNDEERNSESKSSAPSDTTNTGNQSVTESIHEFPGSFSPRARYNRVDGLFAGLNYSVYPTAGLKVSAGGGYSTASKKGTFGGSARYRWRAGRLSSSIRGSYQAGTQSRYNSQIITPFLASIPNILGAKNYFDYYRERAFDFSARVNDSRTDLSLKAGFKTANQASLQTNTGYDITGRNRSPRINPAINEGRMNALQFTAGYNLGDNYTFGVIGRRRIELDLTYSDPALGSDFNFTRYATHIDWQFNTFFKRRLFPNTLNVSLDGGAFSGRLPLQNFGIVDVAPNIVSFFGGLRAARSRPYEGEQYAALNVEHNLRTVPFELLGLKPLVRQNVGLIVFGGAAKTWISNQRKTQIFRRTGYRPLTTGGTHVEAGVSLNGIFNLFRIDFAERLDQPGFLVSIGLTRFR